VIDMMMLHPEKLQAELDIASPSSLPPDWIASFAECKDLPYVNDVIYETLRLRTMVSVGLPRVVSKGGVRLCGEFFEAGTVLRRRLIPRIAIRVFGARMQGILSLSVGRLMINSSWRSTSLYLLMDPVRALVVT
jgi:hypothetical protein